MTESYADLWPIVLGRLGAKHIMVVHSADGLDEISIADETFVAEFKDGNIMELYH